MTSLALVALVLLQCHQGSLEYQAACGTLPLGPGCGEWQGGRWGQDGCADKIVNLDAQDSVCVGVFAGQDEVVLGEETHMQQLKTVEDNTEQETSPATHTQQLNARNEAEQQATLETTLNTNTQQLKAVTDEEQEATQATQTQHLNTAQGNTQPHTAPQRTWQTSQETPPLDTHQTNTHKGNKRQSPIETLRPSTSLPPTSAWCHTMPHSTLQCHFENLYYSPTYQEFAFVLGDDSVLEGVDSLEVLQNHLHLSTALGHNAFLFHVTAVPREAIQGEVWSLEHHTLVMARFKPDNLFHVLHDDVMPLYFSRLKLCAVLGSPCPPITLLAVDEHPESPYSALYHVLGHQILLARDLQDMAWVKLTRATVGLSRHSVWYQYGFRQPQGPVETTLSEAELREFVTFMISRLGVGINGTTGAVKSVGGVATGDLQCVGVDTGKNVPVDLPGKSVESTLLETLENAGNTLETCENALENPNKPEKTQEPINIPENTLKNTPDEPAGNTLENTPPSVTYFLGNSIERISETHENVLESVGSTLETSENAPENPKKPEKTQEPVNIPENTLKNTPDVTEPSGITLKNTPDLTEPSGITLKNTPDLAVFSENILENPGDLPNTPGLENLPEHSLPSTPVTQPSPSTHHSPILAVLLTRHLTRKILNEKQLADAIQHELNKMYGEGVVRIMSLEEHGLNEVVGAVSQARVLVGMHGAGLGVGMFMPSGSLLIEMWPFGIDPASATVYRAMCAVSGVVYRTWVNEDVTNTRTHPHYPPHLGGVQHLPQGERERVVSSLRGDKLVSVTCCMDVNWLYRIYQDTVVRLYAHGDVHEAVTHTDAHRDTQTDAQETHTHTDARRDTHTDAQKTHTHTDAHEAVLKSVPFSVVLKEGLSSLHAPQPPSEPLPHSSLESTPQTFQASETPLSSHSPSSLPQLPLRHPPGRVHNLTCFLQTDNRGTKLKLSWQTPWHIRSLGCDDLVYEVVTAGHSGAEGRQVFVRRERVVLEFDEWLGSVNVWVTCFCEGVEGVAVFVLC